MCGAEDETVDFEALSEKALRDAVLARVKDEGFRIVMLEHSGWRTADNNPMWVITEEL